MAKDSALDVAHSPAAPVAERYDATAEAATVAGSSQLAKTLFPAAEMQPVIDQIRQIYEQEDMQKAARGQLIKGPWQDKKRPKQAGQSVFLDDMQVSLQGDYWERPGLLGFDSMRAMVDQTPVLNAIVMTRIKQVLRFCRPQMEKGGPGFVIKHIDPTVKLSDEQQQSVALLQGFIINCGWEGNPRKRKRLKRDSFSQFMAKSIRDSLSMDASPIETVFKRDRNLGIDGFHAVDGASVRLCTEQGYQGDDEIFAVQVVEGNIRTLYDYDSLVYEVRNPRSDVTACGYGYGEPEMLIKIVTYLLNTMSFNGNYFDKNSIPRGILHMVGNFSQEDTMAFKRYWNAMQRGVDNAHNMPVMFSKDAESKAEFAEIGGQIDEMAFAKWMAFLTSVACAIYGTVPEEISMESFSAGSTSSLSGNDTEEKLVSSSDKGLRPLLSFYEGMLSDFVIQEFSPQYMFAFTGLDEEDKETQFETFKLAATWDEARGKIGLDPVDGALGAAPINATLLQPWMQENGVGLPPEPQDDFGNPDEADAADQGETSPGVADEDSAGADDGSPDFGSTPDDDGGGDEMSKAAPDFGLPPIHIIEP